MAEFVPEVNSADILPLCSVGWRPLLLTGFILEWLRRHFSAANSLEDQELTETLWKADNTTNILIESITRWKPELTGLRPAVIVKRNDIQNVRVGIDDRHFGNTQSGADLYTTYFQGSHTLFCLSNDGAEAEKLASEVYREMVEFGPVMRKLLSFMKLKINGIGAIFRLEESRETFAVPVTINYAFEEAWKIVPRGPVLRRIDLNLFQP